MYVLLWTVLWQKDPMKGPPCDNFVFGLSATVHAQWLAPRYNAEVHYKFCG